MLEESRQGTPLYLEGEKRRQKVSPISVLDGFSWMETGVKEFGGLL